MDRDTDMVERHYKHLERFYFAKAIPAGVPKFRVKPDNELASIGR